MFQSKRAKPRESRCSDGLVSHVPHCSRTGRNTNLARAWDNNTRQVCPIKGTLEIHRSVVRRAAAAVSESDHEAPAGFHRDADITAGGAAH